jgi:hypothetical protein
MHFVRRLLLPTVTELAGYFVSSIGIVLVGNIHSILSIFFVPQDNTSFQNFYHQYADVIFSHINRSNNAARFTNLIVWAGVGTLTYMIIWAIINAIVIVSNDITITTSYTQVNPSSKLYSVMNFTGQGLFRAGAGLLILVLTSLVALVWLPLSLQMVRWWLNNRLVLSNAEMALAAVAGWMVVIYLYTILLRLVFLRVRVFGSDAV